MDVSSPKRWLPFILHMWVKMAPFESRRRGVNSRGMDERGHYPQQVEETSPGRMVSVGRAAGG